jgi:hypothetical protein
MGAGKGWASGPDFPGKLRQINTPVLYSRNIIDLEKEEHMQERIRPRKRGGGEGATTFLKIDFPRYSE